MKRLTLIIGALLLVLNIVIGLISTLYETFNVAVNSGVILISTMLIYLLSVINLRDAYRISLALIFVALGIVEFIIGCLMPQQVQDSWCLHVEIILLGFEILMISVTNFMTNKINK